MTNQFNTSLASDPISWSNAFGDFTLLNGVVGDVAIKVVFSQSGETTLFDLGNLNNMAYGELLAVRQAFISHAHFDHIIGFDPLLRATFPLNCPLAFAGPKGTAHLLSCRMKGYTWNLAAPDQVNHTVREIGHDGSVQSFHLTNTNHFEPVPVENELLVIDKLNSNPFENVPEIAYVGRIGGGLRVFAVCLDHAGIDSVAYCVLTDTKLKFNAGLLKILGLKPGPWVGAFQKDYLEEKYDKTIVLEDQTFTVQELGEKLLEIKPGIKFCYLTDFAYTEKNLERVKPFIAGAEFLGIETNYMDGQDDLALENGHLTTRQASQLIRESGTHSYQTFHFSNAFSDCPEKLLEELHSFLADQQIS